MTKEKVENCKEEMAYDYDLQNELGELALVLDGISDLQAALWQAVCYGSLAGKLIITGSGCCMRKRWSSRNGSGRLRCGCKGVWKIVDNFLSAVS